MIYWHILHTVVNSKVSNIACIFQLLIALSNLSWISLKFILLKIYIAIHLIVENKTWPKMSILKIWFIYLFLLKYCNVTDFAQFTHICCIIDSTTCLIMLKCNMLMCSCQKGRLKICSKSVVFDPKEFKYPVLKVTWNWVILDFYVSLA